MKDTSGAATALHLTVVTAACAAVMNLLRTPLVDDAYITFRYAANIAGGLGCIYNSGEEAVLGVTTPLWAYFLAGASLLGINIEKAAFFLGQAALLGFAIVFWKVYLCKALRPEVGLIGLPLICLSFYPLVTAHSGMETSLYMLLALLVFVALQAERFVWAAAAASLAALSRPDGLLLTAITLTSALAARKRKAHLAAAVSALILLPWLAYAWNTYGSLLPHSIAAKKIIHGASALSNLLMICQVFTFTVYDTILFFLGCAGCAYAGLRGRHRPILFWFAAYTAGLVFSGIQPLFYWYYTPLWSILLSFGLLEAFQCYAEKHSSFAPAWKRRLPPALLYGVVAAMLAAASISRISTKDAAMIRDETYQLIARDFGKKILPSATIYLCETGILGYAFLGSKIYDASGINSRAVYEIRRRALENVKLRGLPAQDIDRRSEWSLDIVRTFRPEWIISPRGWCQMVIMEEQDWFRREYTREAIYYPQHLSGTAVYHRRPINNGLPS